jgi:hypothetical protein
MSQVEKMTTMFVKEKNYTHVYEFDDAERGSEVVEQMKKLSSFSSNQGGSVISTYLPEEMHAHIGGDNRYVETIGDMCVVASSTSNSTYQPHKRAKTLNKIEQFKEREKDKARLRAKLAARKK